MHVDDAKCFDYVCNLETFMECRLNEEEFTALPTHKKRCKRFQQSKNHVCHSELLRIA